MNQLYKVPQDLKKPETLKKSQTLQKPKNLKKPTSQKSTEQLPFWNTTITARLYPTPRQAELFDKTFGCCRYLWNQILSDELRFFIETGEHFLPTPARYKKIAPFLKEVDSVALATVHQDLKKAFQHFFQQPDVYHHPVFKKKKRGQETYTTYCQVYPSGSGASVYCTHNAVRLPKAGEVQAHFHRHPQAHWNLKSATVRKGNDGKYSCSLVYEVPVSKKQIRKQQAITTAITPETTYHIYRNSHDSNPGGCFFTDQFGNQVQLPSGIAKTQQKIAAAQRRLAQMQSGSHNYQQQLAKLQRLYRHETNQRNDFLHQQSRRIANAWNAVQVEDRPWNGTTQDRQSADGFSRFRVYLQYKLERQGKCYTRLIA